MQNFAPKVAFLTGDDEYRSEYSMPALAQILEQNYHLKTQQGFDGLKDADLMVLFLRWRQYPEAKLQAILDYEKSGRPIAGFRTSTHAFKYPAGHPREQENDGFPPYGSSAPNGPATTAIFRRPEPPKPAATKS